MTYKFNVDCSSENYEIRVDTKALYGFFEHRQFGDNKGGELKFKFAPYMGMYQLIGYDGTFELPHEVAKALVDADFIVGWEF